MSSASIDNIVTVERSNPAFDAFGRKQVVLVKEGDVLTRDKVDAAVPGCLQPTLFLVLVNVDSLTQLIPDIVLGTIHDDGFDLVVRLVGNAVERISEQRVAGSAFPNEIMRSLM